jgi:putative endonuclease
VHNGGRGAKYTAGRRPVRLVHLEGFKTVGDALRREHELKRLTRAEKEALVGLHHDRAARRGSR